MAYRKPASAEKEGYSSRTSVLCYPPTKIYDKWDDFNFEIVNFPFLDGDVLALLPMVYIFLSLFVLLELCSNVDDFNNRNLFLTAKLLKQGYRYHKIRKAFSKFYHRHSDILLNTTLG